MPDRFSGSAVIQSIEQIFSQGGIIMAVLAVVAFIVYSQIIDIWLTIRCHTLPEEHQELTEKTKTLAVWVSVAPLLGLLGTVIGMLTTFQSMGTTSRITGATQDPMNGIASGISEALLTTQAGLIIAIPALLLNIGYQRKLQQCAISVATNHTDTLAPASQHINDGGSL